jgi:HK97 family phage prohead protease
MTLIVRTFTISDMTVRTEGDGRVVDAYASVFDVPYEIRDWDGHYMEIFRKGAFKKTASEHKKKKFRKLKVLFNHGTDIYGFPSDRFAMPIGNPERFEEDTKGLITSTRYAHSELADEVLDHIKENRIDSMSFAFRSIQSKTIEAAAGSNDLPTIERLEVAVREYGPCIFPASADAEVVGVRMLADKIRQLDGDNLEQLLDMIRQAPPADHGPGPAPQPSPPEIGPDRLDLMARQAEVMRLRAAAS